MRSIQKHNNINRQIAGLVTFVIFMTLAICYVFNSCFLGDFYLLKKQKDLKAVYNTAYEVCSCGSDDYIEFLENDFSEIAEKQVTSVLITNTDESIVFHYGVDDKILSKRLHETLTEVDINKLEEKGYICEIRSYSTDDIEFIILLGYLPNSDIIFLSAPATEAKIVSAAVNQFFVILMIVGLFFALVISIIIIKRATKPLFDMIEITKKISNFDFSVKYTPQRFYNELDDLGEHINEMSSTLERAINQLKKANESLKAELANQEETENMRKEFISNVSHELKTPIALIQGYAEGLQEGIMDDENSRQIYLDVILDEANKMNRLVREMLILNQLEAGQMDADLCDFNLTDILDGIIDSNKIYFEAQNIDFSFVNKEPVSVKADEFLVEQVFSNFMSNAIHYVMNENIIIVKYEFVKKGKVRVSVYNSGNNIPKKDVKHIWEKFYKVDKARSREYGGSGIGLSVVKATMELLHEKYGVENLSNGVEFWFELALSKDAKNKQNS